MIVKVTEFVWDYISVRQKVKLFLAKFVLHFGDIESQLILSSDLLRGRKVIDLLILV